MDRIEYREIKKYLSQRCIGYSEDRKLSVFECEVLFEDGEKGTVWTIEGEGRTYPVFKEKPNVPVGVEEFLKTKVAANEVRSFAQKLTKLLKQNR